METLTREKADRYGIEYVSGVFISYVEPGSPADDGGLRVGDIILKVDGREVADIGDFRRIVADLKDTHKAISFYIKRGPANMFVAVTPE